MRSHLCEQSINLCSPICAINRTVHWSIDEQSACWSAQARAPRKENVNDSVRKKHGMIVLLFRSCRSHFGGGPRRPTATHQHFRIRRFTTSLRQKDGTVRRTVVCPGRGLHARVTSQMTGGVRVSGRSSVPSSDLCRPYLHSYGLHSYGL